ncbi:Alpha/Beta hydrolase protein [Coniochaeta sp. 2T2.1]|nr:Alpha/Beta hydrolase protein [Coniochaeta sp. 2T2.1]
MASNPPAKCCTIGVKHEGTPSGKSVKVGQHEAYLATPPEGKAHKDTAILYLPDVLGIWQNAQLIADQFAANGYLTLVPDLFNGDPIPVNGLGGMDIMTWLKEGSDGKHPHTKEVVDPIVVEAIKVLKEEYGVKKIGAVGYCFGGKVLFPLPSPSPSSPAPLNPVPPSNLPYTNLPPPQQYVVRHYKDGIQVGFVAHPSFVEEDELAAITGPLSIAAAETDQIFPAEKRHKSEVILKDTKLPYQINLYSGVSHGFAVRCDLSDKVQKWAKEQAFNQAVAWFDQHLV